jgi:cobalt-zinc-cadmium efflux system membrane fusion protein
MTHYRWLVVPLVAITLSSCGRQPEPAARKDAAADSGKTASTSKEADQSAVDKDKPDVVELSGETQRRIGVAVAAAQEATLAVALQVTGSVQPIDSRVAHVRPLARGRVVEVTATVGDRVTRGQALATFDNIEAGELSSQYTTARSELARLRAQLATAARQAERSRTLVDIGAVPRKESESSESEQRQLEESVRGQESTIAGMEERLRRFGVGDLTAVDQRSITTIRAPFAGVVTRVSAGPGEVVDSSAELFSIADISRVYVQAQVYEKDLGRVQTGRTANVRVDAYPEERFTGRIVSVADVIDPQTRTATVRCDVPNPKALLKLDMFATVELPTAASEKVLVVPSDALQTLEGKTIVFVRSGPGTFTARAVERGRTAGAFTEILHGLKPGEPVVTRGAFQVKSARQAKELGEKE